MGPVPVDLVPDPRFFRGPIVTNAMQRLSARGQLTGLDLLESVHRDLLELEERFPGIPFRDVLSAPAADLPVVRRAMRAAGVAEADVELVCGGVRSPHTFGQRFTPAYTNPVVFELLRRVSSVAELAAKLGISESQASYPYSFRRPPTELEQRVLDAMHANPEWSLRATAAHVGCSRPVAQRALCKQAYRQWLAEYYPEEMAA